MPPDDLVEHPLPDPPPQAVEGRAGVRFELDRAGPPLDGREPNLTFAWAPFPVEFGGSWWLDPATAAGMAEPEPGLVFAWAPFPVEFGTSWWVDPERADEPDISPPATRQRAPPWLVGVLAGALGVHLLPLLLLLDWPRPPMAPAGAVPVRLVIEKPPAEDAAETPVPMNRPAPPKAATVVLRPPKPAPPPIPPPPLIATPKPAPARLVAAPPPKPSPPVRQATLPPAPQHPETPPTAAPQPDGSANPATHAAPAAAPEAGAGNYLDYLVTLTRRHFDLLPLSFLAGRRGETVLSVAVRGDGAIADVAIKRSSGYPDIDARIEQMVTAVGRFPPPPPQFQRPNLHLNFKLIFPDALQQ